MNIKVSSSASKHLTIVIENDNFFWGRKWVRTIIVSTLKDTQENDCSEIIKTQHEIKHADRKYLLNLTPARLNNFPRRHDEIKRRYGF